MNPQDLTLDKAADIIGTMSMESNEAVDNLVAEYVRKIEGVQPSIIRPGELVPLNLIVFKNKQQIQAPPFEMLVAVKAYDPSETWFRFCWENPGVVSIPVKVIADLMLRNVTVIRYGRWLKEKGYVRAVIRGASPALKVVAERIGDAAPL